MASVKAHPTLSATPYDVATTCKPPARAHVVTAFNEGAKGERHGKQCAHTGLDRRGMCRIGRIANQYDAIGSSSVDRADDRAQLPGSAIFSSAAKRIGQDGKRSQFGRFKGDNRAKSAQAYPGR